MADAERPRTTGDRPKACQCIAGHQPPCWACYRVGYRTPNPDAD